MNVADRRKANYKRIAKLNIERGAESDDPNIRGQGGVQTRIESDYEVWLQSLTAEELDAYAETRPEEGHMDRLREEFSRRIRVTDESQGERDLPEEPDQ